MARRPSSLDDLIERVGSAAILDQLDAHPLPDEPFDWSAVEIEDRAFVGEVLALADRCCDELLDVEFRTITRRILARVAALGPSALRRSPNRARFAAGLVWLAGSANGEFGARSRWNASSLWCWFRVTSSCSDRGLGIRKAAGLIPEPCTWEPFYERATSIKLGDATLLHSRTRAKLLQQRDAARETAKTFPVPHPLAWSLLADGHTAEIHARLARGVLVGKGRVPATNQVQLILGLGDSFDDADFYALSISDAHDLLDRLDDALAGPTVLPGGSVA